MRRPHHDAPLFGVLSGVYYVFLASAWVLSGLAV
jgi:hypothetical protein